MCNAPWASEPDKYQGYINNHIIYMLQSIMKMINVNIVTLPDSLADPNYGRAINFIQMILDIYLDCNLCEKIPHVWVAIECRLGLRLVIKVLLLNLGIWLVLGLTVELFH